MILFVWESFLTERTPKSCFQLPYLYPTDRLTTPSVYHRCLLRTVRQQE